MNIPRWLSCGIAVAVFASCGSLSAQEAAKPRAQLPWADSLAKGYTQAQQTQRPILVRVGTESCPHCRTLEAEIAKPAAQQALKNWTLVVLDAEKSPNDARLLAVVGVPALRLLTPTGRQTVAHDGAMSADELVAWLKENRAEVAGEKPIGELAEQGPPSAIGVVRLVREFQQRDAVLREAAIRRLMPHPRAAAVQVVGAFQDGKLSTRLASLELLNHWKAPVEGFDPWQPKTITKDGLAKLGEWATSTDFVKLSGELKPSLTAEQLTAARADIDRMLKANDSEAAAIRARLSRFGKLLLPEVAARLKSTETDVARSRLTALRYRLVASPRLAVEWAGGLERLASVNVPIRERAADELARRATSDDEALLLELFSDTAPLIREIALRSLRKVGGDKADGALLKLLDDPEPNVRAAVLKQLAEEPTKSIANAIAAYSAREQDADLLIHAIRVLREEVSEEPARALIRLLKHESWRVRSEAAEGIGKIVFDREWNVDDDGGDSAEEVGKVRNEIKTAATRDLKTLLEDEDAFVVSRAMQALVTPGDIDLVKPLVKVATEKPELAVAAVKLLAEESFPTSVSEELRKFTKHESIPVRAAAIRGLVTRENPASAIDELKAALKDEAESVRVAALKSLDAGLSSQYEMRLEAAQSDESLELIENDEEDEGFLGLINGLLGSSKKPKEPKKEAQKKNPDQLAIDVRDGKVFTKAEFGLAELVAPLTNSESITERMYAAFVLAQLGKDKAAMPVLIDLAESQPAWSESIAGVLKRLLWADREKLFDALTTHARGVRDVEPIARSFLEVRDERALERVWTLFKREDIDAHFSGAVVEMLDGFYLHKYEYVSTPEIPADVVKQTKEKILPKAKSGPRWQRVTALTKLMDLERAEALKITQELFDDEQQPPAMHMAAYRLLLRFSPEQRGRKLAADHLQSKNALMLEQTLLYLALGAEAVKSPEEVYTGSSNYSSSGADELIYPKPPRGLTAKKVEPFLKSESSKLRAIAGYLMVLYNRAEGLTPLLEHWRNAGRADRGIRKLVYRALAHLDEPKHLPVLDEIYRQILKENRYSVDDFYWTVRIMTGPEVLKFRARIRDEVGMRYL